MTKTFHNWYCTSSIVLPALERYELTKGITTRSPNPKIKLAVVMLFFVEKHIFLFLSVIPEINRVI
ncbi:hypothetical protein ACFL1P_01620 [Patescibacteria group bacterium]